MLANRKLDFCARTLTPCAFLNSLLYGVSARMDLPQRSGNGICALLHRLSRLIGLNSPNNAPDRSEHAARRSGLASLDREEQSARQIQVCKARQGDASSRGSVSSGVCAVVGTYRLGNRPASASTYCYVVTVQLGNLAADYADYADGASKTV